MYRKKPVEIEARRLPYDSPPMLKMVAEWCGGVVIDKRAHAFMDGDKVLYVDTLEGRMFAEGGDWIIKGVKGEFYPIKADIFAATYEPVSDYIDHAPFAITWDES